MICKDMDGSSCGEVYAQDSRSCVRWQSRKEEGVEFSFDGTRATLLPNSDPDLVAHVLHSLPPMDHHVSPISGS